MTSDYVSVDQCVHPLPQGSLLRQSNIKRLLPQGLSRLRHMSRSQNSVHPSLKVKIKMAKTDTLDALGDENKHTLNTL